MFDPEAQRAALSEADRETLNQALSWGQGHLFEHWPAPGEAEADKARQLAQLRSLDQQYPGGLAAYVENARRLLAQSKAGHNPYEGFVPKVPTGKRLMLGTEAFEAAEQRGILEAGHTAFVLVAGGLGERLGYSGIKIALPAETASGTCFIGRYAAHIKALEKRYAEVSGVSRQIPLAIMTSGDTDAATRTLLDDNDRFGLAADQVHIVKQEKVPSLRDNDGRFAQNADDPYLVETKPHGHGDVHALLHGSGLADRWLADDYRWLAFFQDTNALVFHALTAAVGVSAAEQYQVNTMVVPRKAGEAAGGIVRLEGSDKALTINVEYNQLDPLLRATVNPEGDVPDTTGNSPYPGNTNVLIMALEPYAKTLASTGGSIPEFVNPKYADASRDRFKKPTRLECMMQDYPKLLGPEANVGFTQFERDVCFSAVKNNLSDAGAKAQKGLPAESASTGEADLYGMHRRLLQLAGAEVGQSPPLNFAGIDVALLPAVSLSPHMLTPSAGLAAKTGRVVISPRSTLVIRGGGEVVLEDLTLDGALVIDAVEGAKVTVRGLSVKNRGWRAVAAPEDADEPTAIRGFTFARDETETLHFATPGEHVVP